MRNTPASSAVEVPTSRSGCTTGGSPARIRDRSAGPSLPAQPDARARSVRRKSSGRVCEPLRPWAMPRPYQILEPAPLAAQLAQVADADGDAGAVAPVEEGDCELAARADQVAKGCRGDLAVPPAVLDDDRLRLLGG